LLVSGIHVVVLSLVADCAKKNIKSKHCWPVAVDLVTLLHNQAPVASAPSYSNGFSAPLRPLAAIVK
jgi:hypothetical protein